MKDRQLFPPELRTASIVPRWSIVWTLNRDTVSNHSYFVTFYAYQIARLLDWSGNVASLMFLALTHDLDETITGDIVSPVKREILDQERAAFYIEARMQERMPTVLEEIDEIRGDPRAHEAWAIIDAADRLDALLYLVTEQRLGNTIIGPRTPGARSRLEAAWRALPAPERVLDQTWATVMLPVIRDHSQSGGFGV